MILASPNVQIAEEKDFVREKISVIFFVNTSQKILKTEFSGFFHLCPHSSRSELRHNIICVVNATSFERQLNIIVRLRTKMNEVALRANDVLRNDVTATP